MEEEKGENNSDRRARKDDLMQRIATGKLFDQHVLHGNEDHTDDDEGNANLWLVNARRSIGGHEAATELLRKRGSGMG